MMGGGGVVNDEAIYKLVSPSIRGGRGLKVRLKIMS